MADPTALSLAEQRVLSTIDQDAECPVGISRAADLMGKHYTLVGDISLLTGERDENFRVKTATGDGSIFKIFGLSQSVEAAELLGAILSYLEHTASDLPVPRLIVGRAGEKIVRFRDEAGRDRLAMMYSFLPGKPLMDAQRQTAQYQQCGALLAKVAQALRAFRHPAMHRPLIWDLRTVPVLRALVPQIPDLPFAPFVHAFLELFVRDVAGPLAMLPHQFVHNDFNARNIIVDTAHEACVSGVIDFGDAIYTARVADVAVGVIGQISAPESADLALQTFVDAYRAISPLEPEERALLPWLVAARIVQNVVMTSWYRSRESEGGHFAAFGPEFFAWRVEFARRLIAGETGVSLSA